jgi:7-cyano-7-deazaguanine synthase in queuosine biosynthesis
MSEALGRHLCILEQQQERNAECSEYARLGAEIKVLPQILNALADGKYRAIHYDLLILCAAIEYADRRWERNDSWSRRLHITIPVKELAIWQEQQIVDGLTQLLRHLTCDTWHFNFVQAKKNQEPDGQTKIVFTDKKTFAIAYSEGLDSRAVWALSGDPREAICIRVAKKRTKAMKGDSLFTRIPFSVKVESRESSFRTRAFQFASITAIAAHIADFSRIVVPESGQGALSPAMLPLHRVYADYRNYPTFFRKMEQFINLLFKHQVHYEQSRLWSTKGQTMCDFLKLPGKTPEDLIETRSCWQVRNVVNKGTRKQCGLCAACLLRRFSLYKANIEEPADTYVIQDLTVPHANQAMTAVRPKYIRSMLSYGIAGVRHFQQFADMARLADESLELHSAELATAMNLPATETLQNLRMLLTAHDKEWNTFLSSLGQKSFLLNWMDGGN